MSENTQYFGPAHCRKEWETQIDAPVGETCIFCQEKIAEGDAGTINFVGQVSHYECQLRLVVGSVGHQKKLCHCFGGDQEDPEGMTTRQSAIAAARLWEKNQINQLLGIHEHVRD